MHFLLCNFVTFPVQNVRHLPVFHKTYSENSHFKTCKCENMVKGWWNQSVVAFSVFLYVEGLLIEICALLYWKQLRCVEGSQLPSLPYTKKSSLCSLSSLTRYAPPIHPLIQRCFLFESESVAQFKMIRKTFVTGKRYHLSCFSTDSCGAPAQTCQAFWAGLPWFLDYDTQPGFLVQKHCVCVWTTPFKYFRK